MVMRRLVIMRLVAVTLLSPASAQTGSCASLLTISFPDVGLTSASASRRIFDGIISGTPLPQKEFSYKTPETMG